MINNPNGVVQCICFMKGPVDRRADYQRAPYAVLSVCELAICIALVAKLAEILSVCSIEGL